MFTATESSDHKSIYHLYYPYTEELSAPPPTPDEDFEVVDSQREDVEREQPVPLRERTIEWPYVQAPATSPDLCHALEFSTGESLQGRSALVTKSLSSGLLQFASEIRDQILSDAETSGMVKLASVATLTIVSTITFQVSNIVEIWLRSLSFLIASIFMSLEMIDILAEMLGSPADIYGTRHRDPFSDVCYQLFTSAVYGMMQTSGGFVHAYHMLTNTEANMPHITKITDHASFGMQKPFVEYFDKTVLPMIDKLCLVKLA